MSESEDCLAMGLVAAGDESAFEGLVKRHRDRLVKWFSKYRPNDAEDLAQETFIRVYQSAKNFRPMDFSAYMFRIARNLLIDGNRRRSVRHGEIVVDMDEWLFCSRDTGPVDAAQSREIEERTRLALLDLPIEQSTTIDLYVDGHSLPEIAEQFSLPLATAKSRLRLGREKLVEALGRTAKEFLS